LPAERAAEVSTVAPSEARSLEETAPTERIVNDVREAMSRRLTGTPNFPVGEGLFLGRTPGAELERLLPRAR
jgi:hypothetical protein